ncbi:hypothetical protein JXQ70_18905 [bacterium]|nr:hypothetical protein [bacterium]
MLTIETLRRDGEDFYAEKEKEGYLDWSGLKDVVDMQAIYKKYEHLVDESFVPVLQKKYEESEGFEKKQMLHLLLFMFEEILLGKVSEKFVDEISQITKDIKIPVSWQKEPLTYRQGQTQKNNLPERDRRTELEDKVDEATAKFIPVRQKMLQAMYDYIRSLGYPGYIPLFSQLKQVDLFEVEKMMLDFADRSDALYKKVLGESAESRMGIPLDQLRRHDLGLMMRGPEYDRYFDGSQAVAKAREFTTRMGIDMYRNNWVIYDLESRPNKLPRPFSCPVRVPTEIYVCMPQEGGLNDYIYFFHEFGHAMHRVYTDPNHTFEIKQIGDKSVSEAFAYLFEMLTLSPTYLVRALGIDEKVAEEIIRFRYLKRLWGVRRYVGKIQYELLLHDEKGFEGKDRAYQQIFERCMGVPYSPTAYVTDLDDGFYSVQYIRAWIIEEQLRQFLIDNFGEEWFFSKEAGDLFKEKLYIHGYAKNGEELLDFLGIGPLDIAPLERNLFKILS